MATLRSTEPIYEHEVYDDGLVAPSFYGMYGAMKAALAMGATHFEVTIDAPRTRQEPVYEDRDRDSFSALLGSGPKLVGHKAVQKRMLRVYAVRDDITTAGTEVPRV